MINGLGGIDRLYGGAGNDAIFGGDSADTIYGGDGDDRIEGGPGADLIYSGSGDDRYVYTSYLDSTPTSMDVLPDYAAGGPGVEGGGNIHLDRFDFSQMDANINMPGIQHFKFLSYLPLTGAGQLHVRYITPTDGYLEASVDGDAAPEFSVHMPGMSHQLLLSDFDFSVTNGFVEPPPVHPTAGTDWIYGKSSPETLFGLDGNDFIFGHELHGQTAGVNSHDNDLIYGGNGIDELRGGWGADTLYGDAGNDVLYGGEFNDTLFGGNGNDPIVHGDSGNDICYGGAGNDALRGGKGIDMLYGGAGDDKFEFRLLTDSNAGGGVDTIMDYNQPGMGHDRIELNELDADSGLAATKPSNSSARLRWPTPVTSTPCARAITSSSRPRSMRTPRPT